MRAGLQLHQQLQSKPGAYQLRLGVVDRLSGKMGTLEVPLKIDALPVKQMVGASPPPHSQ